MTNPAIVSHSNQCTISSLPPATEWLGFLSDEEVAPWRGRQALRKVESYVFGFSGDLSRLYTGANLLALLLFRERDRDSAALVCQAEIDYALSCRDRPDGPAAMYFALQAQVNLLRMEGFIGDVDLALRGLRTLEGLAAGRTTTLPHLHITSDTIHEVEAAGYPIRELALSVAIVDTCKILWRRRRLPQLVSEARRLQRLRPASAMERFPQHAAEAPYLVQPLSFDVAPIETILSTRSGEQMRALHHQLHAASTATREDPAMAERLSVRLFSCRQLFTGGQYRSSLTPVKALASLADTLLRLDRIDHAAQVVGEVLRMPGATLDRAILAGIFKRLETIDAGVGAIGPDRPLTEPEKCALAKVMHATLEKLTPR